MRINDDAEAVEGVLFDFANKTWGGHLELTDEVKELLVEARNDILEILS